MCSCLFPDNLGKNEKHKKAVVIAIALRRRNLFFCGINLVISICYRQLENFQVMGLLLLAS